MAADVAIPIPDGISFEEAATLGVGTEVCITLFPGWRQWLQLLQTACLGIFNCLNIELPNPKTLPSPKGRMGCHIGRFGQCWRLCSAGTLCII